MKIHGIDGSRCTRCEACVRDCPADLFVSSSDEQQRSVGEKQPPRWHDPHGWCIGCGHCTAVCPADAIEYELDRDEAAFGDQRSSAPAFDDALAVLCGRRSVRRYSEKPVSEEDLRVVLEAMRYAPSGHNVQACEFLVLTNRAVIRELADITVRSLLKFSRMIRFRHLMRPFVPKMLFQIMNDPGTAEGIRAMAANHGQGRDVIFFNAPAVVLVSYPELGEMSLIDPTIATTYGALAAHARGLGTCWMGFVQNALMGNRRVNRLLGLPDDRKICSAFILGHPAVKYRRVPPRKEAQVRHLN